MLTATKIKNAKPKDRPYKMFDAHGLFLLVKPNGAGYWHFRYQFDGKQQELSLGPLRLVGLKQARAERDAMLLKIRDGINPAVERKQRKRAAAAEKAADQTLFEFVALEYLAKQAGIPPRPDRTLAQLRTQFNQALDDLAARQSTRAKAGTLKTAHRRLERFIFPYLAKRPIGELTGPEMLAVIRKIEERGVIETAHRTLAICRRVCRFAVSEGKADFDAAGSIDARESLVPFQRRHFPAITEPRKIGELMRAIDSYQGQPSTEAALKFLPLVFVRPRELRAAEWAEFDLDAAEWRIPGTRMKMNREHVVPLARQAVDILNELYPITGHGTYVFPGTRGRNRFISENTLNSALRRLGYTKEEHCPHGFRSTASTRLNEMGFNGDLIELQLAHKPLDQVRAAYNRAERLQERKQMLQSWADYLDALRDGKSNVVAIGKRSTK